MIVILLSLFFNGASVPDGHSPLRDEGFEAGFADLEEVALPVGAEDKGEELADEVVEFLAGPPLVRALGAGGVAPLPGAESRLALGKAAAGLASGALALPMRTTGSTAKAAVGDRPGLDSRWTLDSSFL